MLGMEANVLRLQRMGGGVLSMSYSFCCVTIV